MTPTTYQKPEIRDSNDNIIQQGSFGKNTALSNATNDGWIDYVANDLEALNNNKADANSTAPINSPAFTGTPTAPTPTAGDNSTKVATTAFTHNEIQTNALAITPAYMPEITSGADLNTYLTAGSYRCTRSGVAASLVNTPYTGSNFTLLVIHGGNAAKYVRQILFTTSDAVETTNLIYTRSCDGSGNNWTSWKQIAYAEDVLALSGGTLTGDIAQSSYSNFIIKKLQVGKSLVLLGGNGSWDGGSSLYLNGRENETNAGGFTLFAHDGTNWKSFEGKPNGTLTWSGQPLLPTGVVQAFAGSTIPTGWLLCDGSAVSRTTYAGLFAVIGTTYGSGDGSTTFNLPNLTDKFIEGSGTAGTAKTAGLPNITGARFMGWAANSANGAVIMQSTDEYQSGALYSSTSKTPSGAKYFSGATGDITWQPSTLSIDASRSSSVYGNSTTVQPPALTMKYIIKY